ncbi:hypothetical protein BKA70DRAFT_1565421 [Coprinopsis sp. MPI-PUGE-AT-0042]|nr:hypothetical protein BKA70DRAFT_1565421 [Coprinopsis sp. MPI-PUGE-AT-0042]
MFFTHHRAVSAIMSTTLETHFPTPSLAPHELSPPRFPGISPQSTETLKEVLKDNHQRWHVFINDLGFHNHAAHRALALWALGAPGNVINAGYKTDCTYEKPAMQSPTPITEDSFGEHLGDHTYYSGYVDFFSEYIEKNGMGKALEDWVFSPRANVGTDSKERQQPQMLARFISRVIHPMIHTGHGAEFGLPGMMAEGLAQCAVHDSATKALIPPTLFDGTLFQSLSAKEAKSLTVFEILGEVHDKLHTIEPMARRVQDFDAGLGQHAAILLELASKWELDAHKLENKEYLNSKIEELVFLVVSIYGVAGWTSRAKDQDMRADFFLMHLVTSSIFLPSQSALISPVARARLLHTFLVTTLALYAFFRCPTIDYVSFYAHKDACQKESTEANPWLHLIDDAINHYDEHLTKAQRALATWSAHFGSLNALTFAAANSPGIKGLELLDGSVFLRVAQLTAMRVGPPIKDSKGGTQTHEIASNTRPTEWDFPEISDE